MAAVQFFGRSAVVDAARNRGLELWGLFQSRQFITAGEGFDALDEFLTKLEPGGSAAQYTLKVYRNGEIEDITDKTECNGSFNFKLTEPGATGSAGYTAIMARLDKIEGAIAGTDEDDSDEETFTDIIMGWLREPEKLATVLGSLRSLTGGAPMPPALATGPAAIGTVTDPRESPAFATKSNPAGEMTPERVAAALDRLEKQDPKILIHLEKLANLAETRPDMFKLLLTTLDGL